MINFCHYYDLFMKIFGSVEPKKQFSLKRKGKSVFVGGPTCSFIDRLPYTRVSDQNMSDAQVQNTETAAAALADLEGTQKTLEAAADGKF